MFGGSWKLRLLPSRPSATGAAPLVKLEDVRLQILAALGDCHSTAADRIRNQVRSVRSGGDLLLLAATSTRPWPASTARPKRAGA